MNEDTLKGKWRQLKGGIQRRWGELTDDEVDQIEGNTNQLIGKLQEKYGYTKARAEQEVNDFLAEWND